jgi:hypothetical protein
MKTMLAATFTAIALLTLPSRAASDADVTIIKAEKVTIEEGVITIVAEATTQVTLIQGNDSDEGASRWMGRPVAYVAVKSDKATFIVRRPKEKGLDEAWQESLKAAKDLQAGKPIGRIGFYAPDISIKGNLIDAITGYGFLYVKRE